MPYLGTFRIKFEKSYGCIWKQHPPFEFVYLQNFAKKQKWLNFEPKLPYLGTSD